MSSLLRQLSRRFAGLFTPASTPFDPDSMPLRDWADLPSHHPSCERAALRP